ncbi:hypothetical protein HYH02_009753 [Chlamydomonas schloesseri]|uniref:Uncharacterized protein n=1 Tax=Chlamydomonas schloesseri TaxID=2026947 RepID=A0A835W8U7_9CHLO|nr:hypothetical protein HYH02_009753 [Chlamydomonas schloesseri]|eukprot:KAG2441959.1 hypothetical protein HYH02_009753 [Chlamydomonas schloesseri]
MPDSTIVFTLYGKDNITATAAVCPGETQVLKVIFPQRRLALLTASLGAILPHAGSISRVLDPNCPQRVDLGDSYYLNTAFTLDYISPCNASDAEGVLFKITSAPGAQQWRQSNVTFAVDAACASVTCGLRGGTYRPRPRPASSVPRASPSPSPIGSPSGLSPGYSYGGYSYGGYGYGGYGYGGYGYGGYGYGGYGYYAYGYT